MNLYTEANMTLVSGLVTNSSCVNCTGLPFNSSFLETTTSGVFVPPHPPYNITITTVLALLAGITSFCTTVGNIMVVVSFVMEKSIRQPSNYLIASLAVTDILIGSLSMPLYTLYLLKSYWPLGQIACDLWLSLDYTVCLVSQYTVFLITLDRFCSVKVPAKYRNWRTKNKIKVAIASTWIVPTLIFFTSIMGWHSFSKSVKPVEGQCMAMFQQNELFSAILVISYYWVTLVVMIILYIGIYQVALTLHSKAKKTQERIRKATQNGPMPNGAKAVQPNNVPITKDDTTTSSNNDSDDYKRSNDNNAVVSTTQNGGYLLPTNITEKRPIPPDNLAITANETTALLANNGQDSNEKVCNKATVESPVWKPRQSIPNSSIHWDAFSGQTHHQILMKKVVEVDSGSISSKSLKSARSRRSRNSQNSDNYDSCSETSDSENTNTKPKVLNQLTNIFQNIQQQKQPKQVKAQNTKSKSENRARKALRTITFILGAFVLCWTPYHVIVLVVSFCKNESGCVNPQFYEFSYWLCYMNSPINPFCYALANQQFKKAFLKIFKGEYIREWWRKRH